MGDDGVAHVLSPDGQHMPSKVAAPFADELLESVVEAAEDCPEECIFIEA